MSHKPPLLQFEQFTARRGRFLLDAVSFQVEESEIFSVIGSTGAGKTLLLEGAAGFYRPDAGKALYRGTPVPQIPIHRRNIGYLYQDYSLFPHMTAFANIAYGLVMQKADKATIQARVSEIAEQFGIPGILGQYPGTLSGGEQQRVALARAMVLRPALLLLDEPFSALDPATKASMYQVLRDIREKFRCAVLFVTHDFSEARELADRVGVLLSGRLRGIAEARALFEADWEPEALQFLGIHGKKEVLL